MVIQQKIIDIDWRKNTHLIKSCLYYLSEYIAIDK
jgi:hypothetical protein